MYGIVNTLVNAHGAEKVQIWVEDPGRTIAGTSPRWNLFRLITPWRCLFDLRSLGAYTKGIAHGIGDFDSGVGGLTVAGLQPTATQHIIYFGDTIHVPYGDKTPDELFGYFQRIMAFCAEAGERSSDGV